MAVPQPVATSVRPGRFTGTQPARDVVEAQEVPLGAGDDELTEQVGLVGIAAQLEHVAQSGEGAAVISSVDRGASPARHAPVAERHYARASKSVACTAITGLHPRCSSTRAGRAW